MILRYTPEAQKDLRDIHGYICFELCNPDSAKNVLTKIFKSCANLKEQPMMGRSLAEKTGKTTDLQYIIVNNFCVIYKREEKEISIIRVISTKTKELQDLFE